MIQDCEAGKIDIILTKSISRFARNTVDLLNTVRHLKELGIDVQFEKERIRSLSGDGELMLTLLASFAQEESRSISENVKWGIQKMYRQGIPHSRYRVYGYKWKDDVLVPVPEEASVVKRIFQNFLDGKSRLETERELNAEGITTRCGFPWEDSNIRGILKNITYTGNLLFQKEFVEDPITGKRRKNKGQLPQYLVEETHEAIIDSKTFHYVQDEMARRKKLGALANKSLNLSCFTSKIKCLKCGKILVVTREIAMQSIHPRMVTSTFYGNVALNMSMVAYATPKSSQKKFYKNAWLKSLVSTNLMKQLLQIECSVLMCQIKAF